MQVLSQRTNVLITGTVASVKEEIGDGSDQAITFPCASDLSNACCDPVSSLVHGFLIGSVYAVY